MEGQREGPRPGVGGGLASGPQVDGGRERPQAEGVRLQRGRAHLYQVRRHRRAVGAWDAPLPPPSPSEHPRHNRKGCGLVYRLLLWDTGRYRGVRVLHRSWSWELGSGSKAECERGGVGRGMAFRGAGAALGTWQTQRPGSQRRCVGTARPTPPSTSALTCAGSPCKDRQVTAVFVFLKGNWGLGGGE